jgi:hypothetical protein
MPKIFWALNVSQFERVAPSPLIFPNGASIALNCHKLETS